MDDVTDKEVLTTKPPKGIVGNPGKTGMIFNAEHPYISKLTPDERKTKVKEAFNQLKPALDGDMVQFHGKKGKIQVSLNADESDYLKNFSYAKVVMDKFDGVMEVRPDFKTGKNPEYNYNGVIGDRTKQNTDNIGSYISSSFTNKLKPNKKGKNGQLQDLKECFVALEFKNLDKSNIKVAVDILYDRFKDFSSVKYVFLKKGDAVVLVRNNEIKGSALGKITRVLLKE